jgi:hypothetical protein
MRFFFCLCPCLCLLLGAGCKSAGKPAGGCFASVEINGNTPGQISRMAAEVFRENGYLVAHSGLTETVFEKRGSTMNNLAYGNWMGGEPVWVRVKVFIVQTGEMSSRLQCTATLLRDRNGLMEEEIKVSRLRRGPYQKMLEEVRERLNPAG